MRQDRVKSALRLDAVDRSGLVDSAREPVFDELAALAAQLLDAPFAFVTAVDAERSFWKSSYGIADATRANQVEDSFCQYVIDLGDELVVGDAANHPMTASNPSIESMGVAAWAGCPVELDGQTLGTFCVVDQRTRVWTERDRKILRTLAASVNREVGRRATGEPELEIDRDQIALLRASLLPADLSVPAGLDIAAWHRSASDSVLLGDFYDVVDLGERGVLLVIGDVCGHGHAAAEVTTILRDSIRRAAHEDEQPAAILSTCNADLLRSSPEHGRFATAVVVLLQARDDQFVLHATSAGHPALVVRHPDGSVSSLPAPDGPPLGITADAHYSQQTHDVERGSTLIGYTDGATECRNADDELFGADALAELIGSLDAAASASATLDQLSSGIMTFAGDLTDDIALVAARLAD